MCEPRQQPLGALNQTSLQGQQAPWGTTAVLQVLWEVWVLQVPWCCASPQQGQSWCGATSLQKAT